MKSDWKEQPDGSVDYTGSHVGLFGAISGEAIVENFVLDKIEVKVHTSATVGIVCGYVDAMIKDIGVYNGILTLAPGVAVNSGYSLLGEKSKRIEWSGLPSIDSELGEGEGEGDGDGTGDAAGGDLVIDPNDYSNTKPNVFAGVAAGSATGVPGAVAGTAYYAGPLTAIPGKKNNSFFDMRKYLSDGIKTDFAAEQNPSYTMQKIGEMYKNYSSKDIFISVGIPFKTDGTINLGTKTVKDRANKDINIPQGGIWFKPIGGGTASMAFAVTDKSDDRYAMLYVCERVYDPNIENDPGTLRVVKTVEYPLPKSGLELGDFVYYEYEIPDEDKGKYEYVIGKSNVSGHSADFGFFALALAGTNETGGDGSGSDMEDGKFYPVVIDVDYVLSSTADISAEDYINHQTLLRIDYTSSSEERRIYYLAAGAPGSSLVYYCTTAGVTVTDISVHKQSSRVQTPRCRTRHDGRTLCRKRRYRVAANRGRKEDEHE